MSERIRGRMYLLLGLGGFFLGGYVFYIVIANIDALKNPSDQYIYLLTGLMIVIAGMSNLLIWHGLVRGRVDSVSGRRNAVTIIRNGEIITSSGRMLIWVNIDKDEDAVNDNEAIVLFLCDWRPGSCPMCTFKVKGR